MPDSSNKLNCHSKFVTRRGAAQMIECHQYGRLADPVVPDGARDLATKNGWTASRFARVKACLGNK